MKASRSRLLPTSGRELRTAAFLRSLEKIILQIHTANILFHHSSLLGRTGLTSPSDLCSNLSFSRKPSRPSRTSGEPALDSLEALLPETQSIAQTGNF